METYQIILLLFLFGLLEFIAAFSFNIKIKMIDEKRYTNAAALGAFSTLLFTFMAALAPVVAAASGDESGDMWWFIIAGAVAMAIGNILSLILLKPFNKWLANRSKKQKREEVE